MRSNECTFRPKGSWLAGKPGGDRLARLLPCTSNRVKLSRKCKVHSHFDFIIAFHYKSDFRVQASIWRLNAINGPHYGRRLLAQGERHWNAAQEAGAGGQARGEKQDAGLWEVESMPVDGKSGKAASAKLLTATTRKRSPLRHLGGKLLDVSVSWALCLRFEKDFRFVESRQQKLCFSWEAARICGFAKWIEGCKLES